MLEFLFLLFVLFQYFLGVISPLKKIAIANIGVSSGLSKVYIFLFK